MLRMESETLVLAPPDYIRRFLLHFERIPWFDERVEIVEHQCHDANGQPEIIVSGRVASRPYRARLSLWTNSHVLQAEMVAGPIPWMSCHLIMQPEGPHTRLHRVERYDFGSSWRCRVAEHTAETPLKRAIAHSQLTLKALLEADYLVQQHHTSHAA